MKKITKLVLIALLGVAISCSEDEPATPQNEPQKIENVGTSNTEKPQEEPKEEPTTTPSEPTEPTEPVTPTEPSEPSEPTTPTEPSEPTEPTEPTEPSEPTGPSDEEYDFLKDIVLSEDGKILISYPNVDKLIIPESVEIIGRDAFEYNSQLKEIILPSGITEIRIGGFYQTNATKVVLPEGLISIGQSAFKFSYKLEQITIPSTVAKIEYFAFSGCNKVNTIVMKANFEVGSNLFDYFDYNGQPLTIYISESDYDKYIEKFEDYENLTFAKY